MTATTKFAKPPQPNAVSKGPIATYSGAIMLGPDWWKIGAAGTPVDGTTGANWCGPGSEYSDLTSGNLYINGGTLASPTWKLVTRAA